MRVVLGRAAVAAEHHERGEAPGQSHGGQGRLGEERLFLVRHTRPIGVGVDLRRGRGGDQGRQSPPNPGEAGRTERPCGKDRGGHEPAGLGEHERGHAVLPGVVERMAALGLDLLAGEPALCGVLLSGERPAPPCPPSGTGARAAGRRARLRGRCSAAGARRTRRTRRSRSCPPTRGGDGSPRTGRRCSTRPGRRDPEWPRRPSVRAVRAARPGSGARGPAARHCSPGHGPATPATPVRRDSARGHCGGRGRHRAGSRHVAPTDAGRTVCRLRQTVS